MPKENLDILSMSDEDFAKLSSPEDTASPTPAPATETPPAEEKKETVETPTPEGDQDNTQTGAEPTEEQPESPEPKDETPVPEEKPKDEPEEKPTEEVKAPAETPPAEKKPDEQPEPEDKKKPEPDAQKYEAFFKQVMAPFKANGKLIQPESVDEVVALMQMGANYTKKMQDIQHKKKFLMMLENNELLDESKLSLLIDLHKKNPEAIKHYLKDSKIDPVDLDTSGESNYKTGSHAVTDQEAALSSAISELNEMTGGKETLQSVHAWDSVSKQALWQDPNLLLTIHSQRENGIYAKISAEIEKRKVFGQIGPNVPFLQAYKIIGDELAAKGAFQSVAKPATPAPVPVTARTPVAVRPAKTPPTKAPDTQRLRAAAPTRSSPNPARTTVNVLAMSDEEFSKFANKV